MAALGVGNSFSIINSMVPSFGPLRRTTFLPTVTEEDRIVLNNVQKVVGFLTAGTPNSRTNSQDINAAQVIQELLPILPGISAQILPELSPSSSSDP
ncbi:hypothetical protein C5167_024076 [Papaver somniferum]|uniref:Uncharacterized protein n=1 Tax=Papaver somniferum TaxID=3469 RepID=A0A4Y7JP35_PAPSO|nr:hypothetical protein C5167_024076 [Papaver somniferum]